MADTFKFKPVYGSDEAINRMDKEEGNFYMSKTGGIYFDESDTKRVKLANIDASFVYEQGTSSTEWYIHHGLNKYPNVSVIDSAGTAVVGEVVYVDKNNVILKFSAAFTGRATLN